MAKDTRENEALRAQAAKASALLSARNEGRTNAYGAGPAPTPAPAPAPAPTPKRPQSLGGFIMKNLIYILSVVIVVLVVGLGIILLAPLMPGNPQGEIVQEEAYVSPYDWTKLSRNDGRFAYVDNGEVKSRLGVDVSENQHTIDWDAVAADGIDFAIIRLGYRGATAGDLYLDEQYWANLDGARNAGLDVGIYFFSQAKTVEEAREEADFVLEYLNGTPLEYPIAFDSEERVLGISQSRTSGLDNGTMTAIAEAFCQRIEEAGYESMVYGNANDLSRYRRSSIADNNIWWAEYGMPSPTGKIDMIIWQYSNAGSVDGIVGDVDMNIDLSHALD